MRSHVEQREKAFWAEGEIRNEKVQRAQPSWGQRSSLSREQRVKGQGRRKRHLRCIQRVLCGRPRSLYFAV